MKEAGLILLDKPPEVTSFKALYPVKRLYKGSKVGHTGTLDRFARGLLVCMIGPFTRFNTLFSDFDKEYEATFTFGSQTDTLDPDGKVISTAEVPSYELIEKTLEQFRGRIDQAPPLYSAVHIDGRRAYKAALSGEQLEMPTRVVTIHELEPLGWDGRDLHVRVRCSKGTYIRSLARDIALAAGSCAHVTQLNRTAVGPFSLSMATSLSTLSHDSLIEPKDTVHRIPGIGSAVVEDRYLKRIADGMLCRPHWISSVSIAPEDEFLALFDERKDLAAVVNLTRRGDANEFDSYLFVALKR